MARRIYIVELEVEASDEAADGTKVEPGTFLPTDDEMTTAVMRAMLSLTVRLGYGWGVEAAEVVGKREG